MRQVVADAYSQTIKNILPNPRFANNTTTWSLGTGCIREATSLINVPVVKLTRTASSVVILQLPVGGRLPVTPGKNYIITATGWISQGCSMAIDGGFFNDANVQQTGILRKYIKTSGVSTGASPSVNVNPMVPTTYSVSGVCPAGATVLNVRAFRDNGGDGDTWITKFIVTEDQTYYEYGDGDYPGWSWLGTPHQSHSVGYPAKNVFNLSKNPTAQIDTFGYTASGSSGTRSITRVATDGPNFGPFVRFTYTADGPQPYGNGGDMMYLGRTEWGPSTTQSSFPITVGKVYSGSIWVRPSKSITLAANFLAITATGSGTSQAKANKLCPANVWTKLETLPFNPPAGTVALRFDVDNGDGTIGWLTGDTIDFANTLFVEGSLPANYYDGNSPGWKWVDTAGSSESYGPLVTLESFGRTGGASITGITYNTTVLEDTQGRTLYVVYNVANTTGSFPTVVQWVQSLGSIGVRLQHQGVGVANSQARIDTSNGAANQSVVLSGVRTVGMHTAAISIAEGIGSLIFNIDNSTTTMTVTPGSGLIQPTPQLSMGSANEGVIAWVFDGAHSLTRMRQIQAFLARQYGAPIPAGY